MQNLLQAFLPKQHLMIIWLNRAMTVLCQGFCYIKVIRIYIEIWIIYNNFASEITRLQQNMVALKNLASSENLAPPALLRTQLQPNSKALLRFWNVASKARFFQPPHAPPPPHPPFARVKRGVHSMLSLVVTTLSAVDVANVLHPLS